MKRYRVVVKQDGRKDLAYPTNDLARALDLARESALLPLRTARRLGRTVVVTDQLAGTRVASFS